MSLPRKQLCNIPNIGHSVPNSNRIELVRRKFQPASVRVSNKLYQAVPPYNLAVDCSEEKANNPAHIDNRAGRSGLAETVTQHSPGHLNNCPGCLRMKLMLTATDISAEFTFNEASDIWLDARAKIAPRTRKDYRRYLKSCLPFFGKFRLNELHIGIISKYQKERIATAGAIVINKEVGTILQIRRRANIKDDELEKFYEPLPIPYWTPPRSISNTEESKLLSALQSKSAWEMIYYYAVLALKTGASGCELRGLRLGDINWDTLRMTIHNNAAKNKYRVRTVPLIDDAVAAMKRLKEIAYEKGSFAPHHYLFPFRASRGNYDPDRPMTHSAIKKPWCEARKLAGVSGFRPHDTRHQVNTRLYESGADDMTVMSIMGHQSRAMSEHYSSIRQKRKEEVMRAALGGKSVGASA